MKIIGGQKLVTSLVVLWAVFSVPWLLITFAFGSYAVQIKVPKWFEYVYVLRDGVQVATREPARPLYDLIRSPSEEKLPVAFAELSRGRPDLRSHEGQLEIIEFPDETKLYLSPLLGAPDQAYIKDAYQAQRGARRMVWLKVMAGWFAIMLLPPAFLFGIVWLGSRFRFVD